MVRNFWVNFLMVKYMEKELFINVMEKFYLVDFGLIIYLLEIKTEDYIKIFIINTYIHK
jgi:hypothetical protein